MLHKGQPSPSGPKTLACSCRFGKQGLKYLEPGLAVCFNVVVGAALSVLPKDQRAVYIAAAEHHAPNDLKSFAKDGYAMEGASYWSYGFIH